MRKKFGLFVYSILLGLIGIMQQLEQDGNAENELVEPIFPTEKELDRNDNLQEANGLRKLQVQKNAEKREMKAIAYEKRVNKKLANHCRKFRNESILKMPSICLEYFLNMRKRNTDSDTLNLNLNSDSGSFDSVKSEKVVTAKNQPFIKDQIAFMGKNFIDVEANQEMKHYDFKRQANFDKRCSIDQRFATIINEFNTNSICQMEDLLSGKIAIEFVKLVFTYVQNKPKFKHLFESDRFEEVKIMKPIF